MLKELEDRLRELEEEMSKLDKTENLEARLLIREHIIGFREAYNIVLREEMK